MDGHHQAAFDALALLFGVPPLLAWGASALALNGRPSGGKAAFGISACLVAALFSAFFAYAFKFEPTFAKIVRRHGPGARGRSHHSISFRPPATDGGQVECRDDRQPTAQAVALSLEVRGDAGGLRPPG
jgi:hypothetical protein